MLAAAVSDLAPLAALFASAVLAGSVLPAQSELVLAALVRAGGQPVWLLVAVATIGNVLGAFVNYGLGRSAAQLRGRRWFPLSDAGWQRSTALFNRHGTWILLLSWVPIIGDGFTVIAGAARTPFWWFALLVSVGKGARYWLLAAALA
ncbi:YqaA family protein [Sandarakinorhabdus sp.]|uniref:YqaA family protein n=1 Tax=Sandarakinorhabdus sp. TaxID=1916663 RepID=UPI003341DC55